MNFPTKPASVLQDLQAEIANAAILENANLPDQTYGDSPNGNGKDDSGDGMDGSPDGMDDDVLGQSLLETVTGQALLI